MEVQLFALNLEDNLFALQKELADKTYKPKGYAFFYIRDPKLRPIHKAPVRDRIVFQATFRVLYHVFDKKFIYNSYACRFGKGTHAGVLQLEEFLKKASKNYTSRVFVLKCDIRKFFYSVDHGILFNLIKQEIDDADALDLISKIIDSFHVVSGKGLPLGNVTSQLFANVYLNELDQHIKHVLKEKFYIRYCDDFIIVHSDEDHLTRLVPEINRFLQSQLQLYLHPRKIQIRKLSHGIDFLGYVALPHYRVLRTKTKRRMFKKITRRNLQSFLGMLQHCKGYTLAQKLTIDTS